MAFHCPAEFRDTQTGMAMYGYAGDDGCGVYHLPSCITGRTLRIIASDGQGWDHVSVSVKQGRKDRLPCWAEMCQVKALFWDPEDCVVQYHPPESMYVDNAEVLHMWRLTAGTMPVPDPGLVGVR